MVLKKVQKYAEKIAARYDPHSNPVSLSKVFEKRVTRFTRDPCPLISQCKQKSVLQSLNNASSQGKTWIMLLASKDVNKFSNGA